MRLGFWLTHPLSYGALDGRSVEQWFEAYFLTPPYTPWIEVVLTDYQKWTSLSSDEVQNYLQLLTLADNYPDIKVSFVVGMGGSLEPWSTQLTKLGNFVDAMSAHRSCVSVGIMTEYAGFDYHNYQRWSEIRDVINSYDLPMVNYRSPANNFPNLLIEDGFHDLFHTNYPLRDDGAHTLKGGWQSEYFVGISIGYWSTFNFPGSTSSDGQPRGYSQYAVDSIINQALTIQQDNPGARQFVSLCPGYSSNSFIGVSGVQTNQLWDNPILRSWIWNSPNYRENFVLAA